MTEWRSTCKYNYLYRWLPCQYFILLMMGAWRPKHVVKVCSNKICIFLHHVGVLFNRDKFSINSDNFRFTRSTLLHWIDEVIINPHRLCQCKWKALCWNELRANTILDFRLDWNVCLGSVAGSSEHEYKYSVSSLTKCMLVGVAWFVYANTNLRCHF